MNDQVNEGFGIPETVAAIVESPEQREARIRALAVSQVQAESDEEMLARFKAEERAKRMPVNDTVFPTDTQGFPQDYDKVMIYKGHEKHALPYVPLAINGFAIKVPCDEEAIIPHLFVTECLEHAIENLTVKSQGGLITRPAHRFHFTVKGKATPEEYRAYQEGQRAKAQRELAQAA